MLGVGASLVIGVLLQCGLSALHVNSARLVAYA